MKQRRNLILLGIFALLVLIQFVPPTRRDNPPARGAIQAPPEIEAILQRSCYDCHSNQTSWPWYSRVAPVSWLVTRDVHRGRKEMDFSNWMQLEPRYRETGLDKVLEEVEDGSMPQRRYVWLHREAGLTAADIAKLKQWVEASHLR